MTDPYGRRGRIVTPKIAKGKRARRPPRPMADWYDPNRCYHHDRDDRLSCPECIAAAEAREDER